MMDAILSFIHVITYRCPAWVTEGTTRDGRNLVIYKCDHLQVSSLGSGGDPLNDAILFLNMCAYYLQVSSLGSLGVYVMDAILLLYLPRVLTTCRCPAWVAERTT